MEEESLNQIGSEELEEMKDTFRRLLGPEAVIGGTDFHYDQKAAMRRVLPVCPFCPGCGERIDELGWQALFAQGPWSFGHRECIDRTATHAEALPRGLPREDDREQVLQFLMKQFPYCSACGKLLADRPNLIAANMSLFHAPCAALIGVVD